MEREHCTCVRKGDVIYVKAGRMNIAPNLYRTAEGSAVLHVIFTAKRTESVD
jgi:hypothetical protein